MKGSKGKATAYVLSDNDSFSSLVTLQNYYTERNPQGNLFQDRPLDHFNGLGTNLIIDSKEFSTQQGNASSDLSLFV